MAKDSIPVRCPSCRQDLVVDLKLQQAFLSHKDREKARGDLDDALAQQAHEKERLETTFREAMDRNQREADILDDLFQEARRKAQKNPDERPPNPFDLE